MADRAQDIWALMDLVATPAFSRVSAETAEAIADRLRDHQIERFERPSANPGVYGHPGAGPKQLKFRDAFLNRSHRVYVSVGANRSGKTVAWWGSGLCRYIRDHARDGETFWIIAPDFTKLKLGPHKWLWQFLPRSMFPAERAYTEALGFGTNPVINLTLPDGRGRVTVVSKTEDQALSSFESDSVSIVAWTEAEREVLFDSLISRVLDQGGIILMDLLPTQVWHDLRFKGNPKVYYEHFSMIDNAHNLPAGAIEDALAMMTPEEADVRVYGKSRAAFGVVYKEFKARPVSEGGHIEDDIAVPLPKNGADGSVVEPGWPCWVYIDVGRYTAALLLAISPDEKWHVADEVYTLGLNVKENADQIIRMIERHGRKVQDIASWRMDPAAWAYTAANQVTVGDQYKRAGLPVNGWVRTQTLGEEAMIDKARVAFMHNKLFVMKRCENTAMELQTWRFKTDKDGKIDPNERYTGPNHTLDCLKAWVASNPTFSQPELKILDLPADAY
jgi:hypothetical protein